MKRNIPLRISIKLVLSIFTVFFYVNFNALAQNETTKEPNIVLIFMDDMGYGDLTSYGGIGYETPNIDKMAAEGMRFTNFYSAQAICSASRAAILTGCYPNRIGLTGALFPDSKIGLNSDEETIPEILKKKGYVTSMVGKWHLGEAEQFLPLQHGFDEYFGLPYSNDMWPVGFDNKPVTDSSSWRSRMPPLPLIEGNKTIEYIRDMNDQDRLTKRYTEKAIDFINKNKEKPFFLYFAHSMPHVPLAVSKHFKGKSQQGPYGDVMMEIDWSVGQIMNTLKENNIDKNTLVIFTSDNGPWLNFGNHAGSSGGLREGKQTSFEGGQRVPAIVRWPNVVPAGTINNKLASTIDLLPTFSVISGAMLPSKKIDGVNILSLFKGDKDANPRNHLYYYYNKNSLEGVRMGTWKLVLPHSYQTYEDELPGNDGFPGSRHLDSTGLELYDLRRDPGERYNVKEQNPEVMKSIMDLVNEAREDLGDELIGKQGKNRREPGRIN